MITTTDLIEAREKYRWAGFGVDMANQPGMGKHDRGYWLAQCAVTKQRLRYCCNELHKQLSWKDADGTRLKV